MTTTERGPTTHRLVVGDQWQDLVDGTQRAMVWQDRPDWVVGDWVCCREFASQDGPEFVAPIVGVLPVLGSQVMISIGQVGFPPVLEIRLPRPVASIKNRRQLGTKTTIRGGKVRRVPFSRKTTDQKLDMQMIRNYARIELARRGGTPFGPDDAILLDVRHMIEADELVVRAMRIGELPAKRRGTRRDVHGMIETVADALQGVWYDDDRQVDHAVQMRVRTNT